MDKYEYILQQILLGRANKIIRQVGYITRMGDRSCGHLRERHQLEDLSVDGKIILNAMNRHEMV